MGMGGPQHMGICLACQIDIIRVAAAALQEARVFYPRRGLSQAEFHGISPNLVVPHILLGFTAKEESTGRGSPAPWRL